MKKALVLLSLFLYSCMSMKELPVNMYPYVAEITLIKGIEEINGGIKPIKFKGQKTGKNPTLYLILKNASDRNKVEIKVYHKGKLIKKYLLQFGEKGKYYSRVTLWQRIEASSPGIYTVTIFVNGAFLAMKEFTLYGKKPSGAKKTKKK